MKLLKIFSLAIMVSFLAGFIPTNIQAQNTNTNDLANILVEFETDEIDAKDLDIKEINTLPGELKYKWQIFKENTELFFTFNKEKKVKKLEKISNRRLLEVKKLAETGTDNAADRVEEALKKYEKTRKKINTRLEKNPELKKKLQEKFDSNQIKHQQVLSAVTEKLRDKLPEDKLNRLENIKKENALRWYNSNKDKIQERLENAIDNNDVGSKFKQLKNIAVLEELSDILPEEARDKIEVAINRAERKLSEKLENTNSEDRGKFEKYINNIKLPEITKQRFISNLKDSDKLSPSIKEKAGNIFNRYSNTLRDRFQNLSDEEKRKWLDKFEDKTHGHPANIQLLESLDTFKNKDKIRNLVESQSEKIKARIQVTTDPAKLKILKQNLKNQPILRRQIQDQQIKINTPPTIKPVNDNLPRNIRHLQAISQ